MENRRARPTRLPWTSLVRIAFKNVLRHRGRTGTTLAAVAFGVMALILSQGFVEDIFVQLGEAIVHSQTGHVQLARKGFFERGAHQPERYLVSDPEGDKAKIAQIPQVQDVMARLSFSGLLNNGRADLPIVGEGIEPEKEERLGSFLKVVEGRRLTESDRYGVLLGAGVASALQLHTADRVVLVVNTSDGAMNTLDLEVIGVFQSFSKEYDNRAIKIPLTAAREMLGSKGANTLVVSLKQTSDTDVVSETLRARNVWREQEVKKWTELNDFYPKTVEMYRRQFGGLQLIILLMVLLSVINAVNTAVFERTSEFGTARALGNRGTNVLQMILTENAMVGLVGGLLGVLAGVAIANLVSRIGIPMPPPPNADLPYVAYIRLTYGAVLESFLIGVFATILAALVPAWRMSRMPVAEALRQGV